MKTKPFSIANDTIYGLAAGRVDDQHPARALDVRAAGSRDGLGEHLSRGELHVAVRRL